MQLSMDFSTLKAQMAVERNSMNQLSKSEFDHHTRQLVDGVDVIQYQLETTVMLESNKAFLVDLVSKMKIYIWIRAPAQISPSSSEDESSEEEEDQTADT